MLVELDLAGLAVVDHVRLALLPGLTVLTGETGAGKSIVVDALGLLLGGRADPSLVRAGAERARVEGVFDVSGIDLGGLPGDLGIEVDEGSLVLTREVAAGGRGIARINGRAVPVRTLQGIGRLLCDIHGQTEHLSLLRPREQLEHLDRHAGVAGLRAGVAAAAAAVREVRRELAALQADDRELARRADLLAHQAREIAAARLEPGEEQALRREQSRLRNAGRIAELAGAARSWLSGDGDGDGDGRGAGDLAAGAAAALRELDDLDPVAAAIAGRAASVAAELEDLAGGIRAYAEGVEHDPGRLAEVEDRLQVIAGLQRKYGATVEEILAFGERAAAELDALERAGERVIRLERQERLLLEELGRLAGELSSRRRAAAAALAAEVEEELAELGMAGTRLAVGFAWQASESGAPVPGLGPGDLVVAAGGSAGEARPAEPLAFDDTGVDRVELSIAPNPGEPLRPLARTASGGEASRLMLAFRTVLAGTGAVPVLVFDEIDAGVGGRVGEVVGRKLWRLGRRHQVIAVTHLPQIACFGDHHFQVSKHVAAGRTVTRVVPLAGQDRTAELGHMLGAGTDATLRTAAELLRQAGSAKRAMAGSPPA